MKDVRGRRAKHVNAFDRYDLSKFHISMYRNFIYIYSVRYPISNTIIVLYYKSTWYLPRVTPTRQHTYFGRFREFQPPPPAPEVWTFFL